MASADELRQAIATNRQTFTDAVRAAADKWTSGDDDGWSPRKIAEHCIARDEELTAMTVGALAGSRVTDSITRSFATAADALSALDAGAKASDDAYQNVADIDLHAPAPLQNTDPYNSNIGSVMKRAAWHLKDHAHQLDKA